MPTQDGRDVSKYRKLSKCTEEPPSILSEKTARYGWGSSHPWFDLLVRETRPRIIIEVGSWLGASAVHMAKLSAKYGLNTKVICVDTWLGAPALYRDPTHAETLAFRDGYPTLFHGFLASVVEAGCGERIVPLPLPSALAADVLVSRDIKAELVYVDADHSFAGCLADLRAYSQLLTEDGVILGDDFDGAGVSGAVAAFLAEDATRWHLYVHDAKYLLSRTPFEALEIYETELKTVRSEGPHVYTLLPSPHITDQIASLSLGRMLSLKLRGKWQGFVRSVLAGRR